MILTFFLALNNDSICEELNPKLDLKISKIIDNISNDYEQKLLYFLKNKFIPNMVTDYETEYALKEIFCFKHYIPDSILKNKIEKLISSINELNLIENNEKSLIVGDLIKTIREFGDYKLNGEF
jgi:hypothetical protein